MTLYEELNGRENINSLIWITIKTSLWKYMFQWTYKNLGCSKYLKFVPNSIDLKILNNLSNNLELVLPIAIEHETIKQIIILMAVSPNATWQSNGFLLKNENLLVESKKSAHENLQTSEIPPAGKINFSICGT